MKLDIDYIDAAFINDHTKFPALIEALKQTFALNTIDVPKRHHHDFANPQEGLDSTLLLMPAWNPGKEAGVKIVTVSPNNGKYDLPAIQGMYIYLDAHKGSVRAIFEAKALTAKRTAAVSAMASVFLSRKNSSSLLMIGTGALSKNLILAHASIRPITKVYIWGRNIDKAKAICSDLANESFSIEAVANIEDVIAAVDIISCATLSPTPLVFGKYLQPGQHLDLVGAYKKDTREADDEAISKADIFIDTYYGALHEAGEIMIPIQNGTLKETDIKADLAALCSGNRPGRTSEDSITVFKSVGHSLEDLVAAKYYYDQL